MPSESDQAVDDDFKTLAIDSARSTELERQRSYLERHLRNSVAQPAGLQMRRQNA